MPRTGKTTATETVGGESRKEPRPDHHHTSVEKRRYGCDDQGDNKGAASISLRCSAQSIPDGGTESTYCEDDGGDHSDGDLVSHGLQRIGSTNRDRPEVPFTREPGLVVAAPNDAPNNACPSRPAGLLRPQIRNDGGSLTRPST